MTLTLDPFLAVPDENYQFLSSLLDTVHHQIVVINNTGRIIFINKRWQIFARNNDCLINDWSRVNYIEECERAAADGDPYGIRVLEGLQRVIAGKDLSFYLEYPCNSPTEKRWFMMWVNPFPVGRETYYVITHHDITQRKLAEDEVLALSKLDGLTAIPNRRAVDEFFNNEWRRCRRLQLPLSYLIIDIDYFKKVNDTYGHSVGDECLKKVAKVIQNYTNRPSDYCGRYGGEEFIIIWGETLFAEAKQLSSKLVADMAAINVEYQGQVMDIKPTASGGLVTLVPHENLEKDHVFKLADTLLYDAKKRGRNRIETFCSMSSFSPLGV